MTAAVESHANGSACYAQPYAETAIVDAVQECGSTKAYTTIPCNLATSA